jgi:peptidoglycan/LPS O-acetylase OafA/YrhL
MYFALLDILRFLSAVAVLFHHTFIFHYGKLGVYLFFIISGFVIYFSLGKGLKEYALGRFIRLYPLFWVSCTLTYLVTLFYGNNLPIEKYAVSMLMFNDGKIAQLVDGSYWTLTFELLFYAYVGIFVWLFSAKKLEWFYGSWLIVSFLSFFFKIDQVFFIKLLSVRFAPYFVFGGMLALAIDRFKVSTYKEKSMYGVMLLSAALMPLYISDKLRLQKDTISNFTGSFNPDEMIIVELFFLLIPLAVYFSYNSHIKSNKTFTKIALVLGGITYPLYLLHWKIGETLIRAYGFTYGEISYFSVGVALLIVFVSYCFSVYDLSLRKYLKKKFF